MKKQVLVLFEDNWADEMDIYGFSIMTEDQWNYRVLELKAIEYPIEVPFGTNESNEYYSAEEMLECYTVKEITDEEAEIIRRLLSDDYGRFSIPEGNAPQEFYDNNKYPE